MTDLELTKLWLNGYHEQAISHGLTQAVFRQQLRKLGYSSPELDRLPNALMEQACYN